MARFLLLLNCVFNARVDRTFSLCLADRFCLAVSILTARCTYVGTYFFLTVQVSSYVGKYLALHRFFQFFCIVVVLFLIDSP